MMVFDTIILSFSLIYIAILFDVDRKHVTRNRYIDNFMFISKTYVRFMEVMRVHTANFSYVNGGWLQGGRDD